MPKPLIITPVTGFPLVKPGNNIAALIWQTLQENHIPLENNDILVVTQKIISKAENQIVILDLIGPSEEALLLAEETDKNPALCQVIIDQSSQILRRRPGLIISEHRIGFVCANAGVDHSNLDQAGRDRVLCLPEDPDRSAENIRLFLEEKSGKSIGVLIIDSHGRAWRLGTVGISIGTSMVPELVNKIGDQDLFGRELRATVIGAADQLAAAAALVMGEADEGIPLVHVRGFPYSLRKSSINEVIRTKEKDLFR
ncbi:MAG TPA: coenzyme F420-0:L-glutamate ligase [Chloroflexi bacterium]|nr:coenzyme F420-0:L-glutamate ligase [Chloroflexota bacterium]